MPVNKAIVADLETAGYLTWARSGRRNFYEINRESLFRHSAQEGLRLGSCLDVFAAKPHLRRSDP